MTLPKKPKSNPLTYAQAHPQRYGLPCYLCHHPWRALIEQAYADHLGNKQIFDWLRAEGDAQVTIDKIKNHRSNHWKQP